MDSSIIRLRDHARLRPWRAAPPPHAPGPATLVPLPDARPRAAAFQAARAELESLGLRIMPVPHRSSSPYAVLQAGAADARRWLVPLYPRCARVGSLALIQPGRAVARALKQAAIRARGVGLESLWASGRVHVSNVQPAVVAFDSRARQAAFFTGTPGPHRKAVVQLMDARGGIRGYVKVASSTAASALLQHEAATLRWLHALDLRSAWIPQATTFHTAGGVTVLATDTIKTLGSACPVRLQRVHLDFLDELAARTGSRWVMTGDALLARWDAQARQLAGAVAPAWSARLRDALAYLACGPDRIAPMGLAHGDFTPTNTFVQHGRLGVFDWEYAGNAYPADFDLLRFIGCRPAVRRARPAERGAAMARALEREFGRSPVDASLRVVAYLCAYALRCARRERDSRVGALTWVGEGEQACALDALLLRMFRH